MSARPLITKLRIDEIWHTVRHREPVRFGLPLPESLLRDVGELSLELNGQSLPVQTRVLSKWPDGSVRWALIDFQADLDLREPAELTVLNAPPAKCAPGLEILRSEGTRIDTGVASVSVPDVAPLSLAGAMNVSLAVCEESLGELQVGAGEAQVVSSGPLVAELVAVAPCYSGDEHVLDLRLELRFFAGKSYLRAGVTVMSRERDLRISLLRADVIPTGDRQVEFRAHTTMKRARVSETELLYTFAVDSRSDPIWYEDSPEPCWALWRGETGGVMASVRNPDHHFPTRIAATPEGIQLDLHPEGQEPFHMYPWMAKTKEVLVSLVPPGKTGYEMTLDSALFQRPVRPVCDPGYNAECRAFGDIFPTSRKYASFEGLIATSLRERTVGCGAMHYGDEPNLGYTYDDRGHGELVWTNGEYDTPRMLLMQYARTANRSWFEAAEAAALHWMDIDFLRHSENPRWSGGLCCHEGDHRVAAYAGPSHEWCEGLIDYYHLTGSERALETALSIGDNVCRYIEDGEFDRVGTYALRELGWGLTAISGCLRATNASRFCETGLRAVRILSEWADTFGGFRDVGRYTEPGADEMMPLTVQRDAFVSLTLNGLNRFYLASDEEEAKALFLREVRAQLDWFNSPAGWAEQRETKLPNLEAFAYGYSYTGDRAYLDAGLQILDYALSNCVLRFYNMKRSVLDESRDHPATYRFQEVHAINSQILGLALIPMFAFMQTADNAGVLEGRVR